MRLLLGGLITFFGTLFAAALVALGDPGERGFAFVDPAAGQVLAALGLQR